MTAVASASELKAFYMGRSKNPALYTYSETGDLIQKGKDGVIVNTITMPVYRPPTSDEFAKMAEERMKRIAEAEEKYEGLRKELRALFESGAGMSELMRKNQEVEVADIELENTRFALKTIMEEDSVEVRNLLFEERYETRKVPYSIGRMVTSPYSLQDMYVRIGELSRVSEPVSAESGATIEDRPVILFSRPDTNDYGFLSMQWPVDFTMNGRLYSSAYQALMGELAASFGDDANLSAIVAAEGPSDITYTWQDASGATEEAWNIRLDSLLIPVNKAKFIAHPELGEKLIQTGNAILGAIEPMDNVLGIGLTIDDTDAMVSSRWTGQNKIGRAVEQVRDELKADRLAPAAPATTTITAPPIRIRRRITAPAVQQQP